MNARRGHSRGVSTNAEVYLENPTVTEHGIRFDASGDRLEQDARSKMNLTKYSGNVWFDPSEVADLFRSVVETSDKSDEFKRVCLAVVEEFDRARA